jgi:phage host-nuclease inhibitor protein Gam
MAKLYEISDRYKNIQELLDNPDLPEVDILQALSKIDEEFDTKAENIAKLISALNSDIDGMAKEIKRLQNRKSVMEHRADDLKSYIYEHMKALNKKKIKGKLFTLSIQKNSPSVSVIDEGAVLGQYKIPQPPKLDKKAILTDLKRDKKIDGVEIKQGTSLRIR